MSIMLALFGCGFRANWLGYRGMCTILFGSSSGYRGM
jgi:hypothetical protein